ncbi:MAG: hypothetical protein AB7U20_20265 [Planctomycetaceae bacterium]
MSERITESMDPADGLSQMLSRLQPRASGIARDQLMFLAGRQAGLRELTGRRRWAWPAATAASWLLTAAVVGLWAHSLDEPRRSILARNAEDDTLIESVGRPVPQSSADHASKSRPQVEAGPSVARSSKTAPARDNRIPQQGRLLTVDTLLGSNDLPRLSMVGWQSRQQVNRTPTDARLPPAPAESVVVPPATYSRLMKLYLDDPADSVFQGDRL